VKSPADVVKVNQKVAVTVLSVDPERKRISLSMKKTPALKDHPPVDSEAGHPREKIGKQPKQMGIKPSRDHRESFNNPFAEAFHKQGKT
jgi:uncharacterized protein